MLNIIKSGLCAFTILGVLGLCWSCHNCPVVRDRGYHISSSCRPICRGQQTCVVYRSHNGIPVTTCVSINPHLYHLEGTRLIPKTNLHVPQINGPGVPQQQLTKPTYLTEINEINPIISEAAQQPTIRTNTNDINPMLTQRRQLIDSTRGRLIQFGVENRLSRPSIRVQVPVPSTAIRRPPVARDAFPPGMLPTNRNDKIALQHTMDRVFGKTGIRPDANSRLVDFKLHGVSARKVDVLIPINNVVETADKGLNPAPAELQRTKIDPNVGVTPSLASALRDTMFSIFGRPIEPNFRVVDLTSNDVRGRIPTTTQGNIMRTPTRTNNTTAAATANTDACESCAGKTCPEGLYCYHSTTCNIMVCQKL